MNLDEILELDRLAVQSVQTLTHRRLLWDKLQAHGGRPFVALVGPRGSGKTILLRQLRALYQDALYLSADTLERDQDLFSLLKQLHESLKITRFYLDEIHFVREFAGHLKRIHDFLPVRVLLTSSVALSLTSSAWDLARRVVTVRLWPFSCREFLYFQGEPLPDPVDIVSLLEGNIPPGHLRLGTRFRTYLTGGLYPFMREPGAGLQLFESILKKVVNSDIPSIYPSLTLEETETMQKLVRFIGRSAVDGISYSSVARSLGITKYKAEQYLSYLEESFVIHRILPRGSNVLKEPKVLLQLPYRLLYQEYDLAVGALREEFFVLAMRQHGIPFDYLKSTRGAKTPDYLISSDNSEVVIEIGGTGKGRSQFKDVGRHRKLILFHEAEDSAILPGQRMPLFSVGFPATSQG